MRPDTATGPYGRRPESFRAENVVVLEAQPSLLEPYRGLADDWDGWGSPAPSEATLRNVEATIRRLRLAERTIREVTLGVDQVFFIEADGVTAQVYFDGDVVLGFPTEAGPTEFIDVPLGAVYREVSRRIRENAEYAAG